MDRYKMIDNYCNYLDDMSNELRTVSSDLEAVDELVKAILINTKHFGKSYKLIVDKEED